MRKTSELIWQDAQHQVLFSILEQINTPGAGTVLFHRLRDYSENHFSIEERYMAELGYPEQEEHINAHNRFRSEVVQLLEDDHPDQLSREIISTFLTGWLTKHVFGTDKKLEDFILKSHVK